jgi:hypothetical protein
MASASTPMDVDIQWSENEMQLISEWITYGQQIVDLGNELKQHGCMSTEFPKLPNQSIKNLLYGVKSKKPRLSGIDLNKYLISKLVATTISPLPTLNINSTLEEMSGHLKSGYEHIIQKIVKSLVIILLMGYGLTLLTPSLRIKKLRGYIKISWSKWLADNVGIEDSYSRKIRAIAKVCEGYSKMRQLGIPMSELYNLRKEISEMLTSNIDNCAVFWKG